jgi:hypothetical protein
MLEWKRLKIKHNHISRQSLSVPRKILKNQPQPARFNNSLNPKKVTTFQTAFSTVYRGRAARTTSVSHFACEGVKLEFKLLF